MGIQIGDKNKIKNSSIIDGSNNNINKAPTESFVNKHPILIGILCSIIASVILMIPFWDKVSNFIKNLF